MNSLEKSKFIGITKDLSKEYTQLEILKILRRLELSSSQSEKLSKKEITKKEITKSKNEAKSDLHESKYGESLNFDEDGNFFLSWTRSNYSQYYLIYSSKNNITDVEDSSVITTGAGILIFKKHSISFITLLI